MGEIVAAMATCHAPQLFTYPPDEDPAQLDATITAMRQLGRLLDETRPDVLIFLGSDHLETFSIGCVPTFAIVAGNRAIAEFAGRRYDLPIQREMAECFLNRLVRAGFDMAYSEDAVLGHTLPFPSSSCWQGARFRSCHSTPMCTCHRYPARPGVRRLERRSRE